jgi:hypothetical protein
MTGYRKAHGDYAAICLDVNNDYHAYTAAQLIIDVAWYDDDDNTWNDIDEAAALLHDFVSTLDTSLPKFSDIAGADLASIDWRAMVVEEIQERNLQDGRPRNAGLEGH